MKMKKKTTKNESRIIKKRKSELGKHSETIIMVTAEQNKKVE